MKNLIKVFLIIFNVICATETARENELCTEKEEIRIFEKTEKCRIKKMDKTIVVVNFKRQMRAEM